ncbi:hypothetical protein ACHAXR_006233 [Thalassiosira sp. AJA248-18]
MAGGKKKKSKGGRGRGRGRGGGGGRGRGAGRGRGGAAAGSVVRRGPPQVRLFYLKQHLILKCFNYLDDASRKNVFRVMGWPLDNYEKRKEMMRKKQENMEKMRQQRLEEGGEKNSSNNEVQDSSSQTGTDEAKHDETNSPENKEEKGKSPLFDLKNLTTSINEAWNDTDDGEAKTEDEAQEETNTSDADTKPDGEAKSAGNESSEEKGVIDVTETTTSGEKGASDAGDHNTDDGAEGETKTNEESAPVQKEILPPLFARTDPDTLLARLNTRRLYQRIVHYKREQRKKLEADWLILSENQQADDGIKEMFDKELKEKMTADRMYRKGVTIQEMSELEWDELLEMAEIRNNGNEVPFDPIPTEHELLLFSPCPRAVAVLASYPRSGNSLMRTLYEHTTLRVTGSDMQGGLAKHDLVGEMAVGTNMVQFVKTHFPERQGTPPFRASRVVLLVRNPFDSIESFFNLMMTGKHTTSVTPEVREKTAKVWEEYVLKEIRVWKGFHTFWMNQDVPLLLIRYEDLIRQPDKVMSRVVQFVLEIQRMGTFFTERINRCILEQEEIERMGSYKPRSGGIGKSLSKYSPALLNTLKNDKELKEIMGHLGYSDLLVKPPEEWSTLQPLKDYATEYLPSWHRSGNAKVVLLNRGNLARGKNEVTPWQKIKVELGIAEENCDCEKCKAMRKRGDSSNDPGGGSGEQEEKAGE